MKQRLGVFLMSVLMILIFTACADEQPKDTMYYTTPSIKIEETTIDTSTNNSVTTPSSTTEATATTETTSSSLVTNTAQTFSFKEEFDAKHHAIKITVISNKKAFVRDLHDEMGIISILEGEYIENYKYFTDRFDGRLWVGSDYMESPIVIYLPVSRYANLQGKTLYIQGENYKDTDGKMQTANAAYTLSFDYESCYSTKPMKMNNEFLHKALTAYFDGEYSHRDLLKINSLYIDYENFDMKSRTYLSPVIMMGYANIGDSEWITKSYNYSDFFDDIIEKPSLMPSELLEDLSYFPVIQSIVLRDKDGNEKFDEIEKTLLPYKVTEDTWSDESQ